jgi:predicted phosphodiesterase
MAREKLADHVERIVEADIETEKLRAQLVALKRSYKAALVAIDNERKKSHSLAALAGIEASKKPPKRRKKARGEATAVVLLSDWHVEERVPGETIGWKNNFDLRIADQRLAELSDRIETLIHHERHLAKIDRIVIAALGDFISNIIHDDTAELAQLAPLAATRWAGERLRSIIDRAARLADEVIVVTAVGNHGRSVMKPRIGTEHDHSFEQNLYLMMAASEKNDNVVWQVGEGYLNVVDLDGYRIACHHGHGITGNIHVGATRAIAQWQRSTPVDLHVFGHHHQFSWCRGKYVSNGSLIGYNAYALRNRFDYEAPSQSLLVVSHERHECTRAIPIFCDRDLQEEAGTCKSRQSMVGTSRASTRRTRSSEKSSRPGKVRKR